MHHPCEIPSVEYRKPRLEHRLEVLPLLAVNKLFAVAPARVGRWLAKTLAGLAYRILSKKVKESLLQIETKLQVSPHKAQQILRRSFENFALNWLAQVAPSKVLSHRRIELHGLEKIEQARLQGRGTVMAAMHMGLWEAMPRLFKQYEYPVAIVVAVQHNPLCDKIFNELRSAEGYHYVIHNRLGVRHLLKYLKNGGCVVILSDVDIGDSGLAVPFLNQPASTPSWPAELALRTGAQMLMGYTHLTHDSLQGALVELPDPETLKDHPNPTQFLCEAMNNAMSEVIRKYPEQWFWMQRRWKTSVDRLKR